MDNVVCSCLKCGSELGTFRNSWIGIGNSYFSPVYPLVTYIDGFEATGEVFEKGPDGSAVQNSVLQDLACQKCATVVGLRCDDAPAGHLLKKNQLILRLAEMQVLSEKTGSKAVISVQQKFPLAAPGQKKLPAPRRAATAQPTTRKRTPSLLAEHKNPKSNGPMLPPTQEKLGREVAKLLSWEDEPIKSQQMDIDRISGAVARIEKDMSSFKDFMAEVRAELATNRATRKTQQDLNQEQIVWLQEDMKELRQENGDFQQDLREEEIPDIRNQLEQLRQEIDSKDRFTELPGLETLPSADAFKHLGRDVMRMNRKSEEINGLKMELQTLQKRLADMEGRRQDSFVFPKTLIEAPRAPNHPSNATAQPRRMPTKVNSIVQLMIEGPEDAGARSMMTRNGPQSPTFPGAFPDSITDVEAPVQNRTAGKHTLPSKSRSGPSSIPTKTQKWAYTGLPQWRRVKIAFGAFGLEYPKLGVSESIRVLEDHVNDSILQNTATALQYGKVASGNGKDREHQDEPEASLSKRKHDQVGDEEQPPPRDHMRKKRRRLSVAEDELLILKSPTFRPGPLEHRVSTIMDLDRCSPEVAGGNGILSLPEDEGLRSSRSLVPKSFPNSTPISGSSNYDLQSTFKCGSCGKRYKSISGFDYHKQHSECDAHENDEIPRDFPCPNPTCKKRFPWKEGLRYHIAHSESCREAEDERRKSLGRVQRLPLRSQSENAVLRSIEGDAAIPGAFPFSDAAAPDSNSKEDSKASIFDMPKDADKPFQCGCCSSRYKTPAGLKYHKTHTSCTDTSADVIPTKFKCQACGKELSWDGWAWHVANSVTCRGDHKKRKRRSTAALVADEEPADDEQKRKEVMAARERLVKETLEREG